jgi:hypothetical protein
MARGFWAHFLDNEYKQRDDIDSTIDQVEHLQRFADVQDQNLRQMQRKFMQLAVTVDVLLDILAEHNLLDESELERRVELRLNPPPPPPKPQPTGSPYRDAVPAEAPPKPVPTTTCTRCSKRVPLPSTQITADGVVCDPCFNSR